MKTINMTYDSYQKEAWYNDGMQCDFFDARNGKEELSEWCDEFLEYVIDSANDDLTICLTALEKDCDTLEDKIAEFNKANKDFKIKFKRNVSSSVSTNSNGGVKIEKLKNLYNKMRSAECPFKELREDTNIENSFKKALDNEFEIAVVATMSSGKSTLINAMLGQELLPARNEATTATIARIHDDKSAAHFWGESFDADGRHIKKCDPLTLDNMNELNNSTDTSDIEIYGNIKGISSNGLNLVLTDTPGPNNSRTTEHKTHTYRLIQDSKYKPMVLYLLNGTQLETNDDNKLLGDIAHAMKSGDRQASDRFIFVLNKADEFDSEKGESVEKKIQDTKEYLAKHGIDKPKIFPCASKMAKILRQAASGQTLTTKEKAALHGDVYLFLEDANYHFSDLAPLSDSVRKEINDRLHEANAKNDTNSEVLIYTGIPAVEAAISEYLVKYALPAKITEALCSFGQTIKDLDLQANEKRKLGENREKVAETQKAIEKISTQIEKGSKATELKDKIDALSVERDLLEAFESMSGTKTQDFIDRAKNKCSDKVSYREADKKIIEIQKDIEEFKNEFAVDIENLISEKIGNEAKKYVDEYNNYVQDLLGTAFGHEVKPASLLGSLATMHLDSDVSGYTSEEKEVVGTHVETRSKTVMKTVNKTGHRMVKNTNKKWYKPWTWGEPKEIVQSYTYQEDVPETVEYDVEVKDYAMRQYVDLSRFFNEMVLPLFDELGTSTRKLVEQSAKEEEKKLKANFKKSFDELNEKIQEKLEEQKRTLGDQKAFEAELAQNEKNLAWLEKFNKDLKDVLAS